MNILFKLRQWSYINHLKQAITTCIRDIHNYEIEFSRNPHYKNEAFWKHRYETAILLKEYNESILEEAKEAKTNTSLEEIKKTTLEQYKFKQFMHEMYKEMDE